LNGYLNNS